ncbi:PepSY-associated TM helix domain-containing protein [Roseococcus sp.]|uniref:PepSY-associated TM helix domain-containing protein n=1 Tax=Roseococcus sp. TaxID=2109646 RepID=UPI003BAB7ABF
MKNGFRQSMAWLHTWSGLLVGWILFAVFLTGTASYFKGEISQWMQPELRAYSAGPESAAELAIGTLQRVAPQSPAWFINLPQERDPFIRVFWRGNGPRRFQSATLDPVSGEPVTSRKTMGGEFFYRFHFELHMQPIWGRWVVSFCAMMMLVAIISGIITHRRIFADFFTFRPGKAPQRSWLDAHNALAVLALPYHLMITYTGLITLMLMTMPWGAQVAYRGNVQAFFAETVGVPAPPRAAGRPGELVPMRPLLAEAMRHWGTQEISRINVQNPSDANSVIQISRGERGRLSMNPQTLVFQGTSGERTYETNSDRPAAATRGVTYGLHLGRFAGPLLRALFFLSGLAGTAMVATGLVLWAAKHRQKRAALGKPGFGMRLVDMLNVGTVAGLPIAMAGFFWANRLLPVDIALRAEWEIRIFFGLWVAALLHALLRPVRRAWIEQFAFAALLGLAIPLLSALTTNRHLGVSIPEGDWALAGMDLGLAGMGALLGVIAWKLARRPETVAFQRRKRDAAMPALAESA